MDSLYDETLHSSFDDPEIVKNEPSRLKFFRYADIMCLLLFFIVWSLNFIWVGWAGAYTAIMIYSLLFSIVNVIFIVGKHSQRMEGLEKAKKPVWILYGAELVALGLSLAFFIIGCIDTNKYATQPTVLRPAD
jgi:hypothetical protein